MSCKEKPRDTGASPLHFRLPRVDSRPGDRNGGHSCPDRGPKSKQTVLMQVLTLGVPFWARPTPGRRRSRDLCLQLGCELPPGGHGNAGLSRAVRQAQLTRPLGGPWGPPFLKALVFLGPAVVALNLGCGEKCDVNRSLMSSPDLKTTWWPSSAA